MPLTNRGLYEIISGATDWGGSTDLRVILVDTNYTFDPDHNFVSEAIAGSQELSATGYARQTLGTRTVTELDATNRVMLDAADVAFGALSTGDTIGGIIIYRHVGADDTANPYIGFVDVSPGIPTNGSTFTAQWSADGLFYADSP